MDPRALLGLSLATFLGCSSGTSASGDGSDGGGDTAVDGIVPPADADHAVCFDETPAVNGAACTHPGDVRCDGQNVCVPCYHDRWSFSRTSCDCIAGTWKCNVAGVYDCFLPTAGTFEDAACTKRSVTDAGTDASDADALDTGDAAGAKCGDKTCAASEYCVHPCCGGADTGAPCKPAPPFCTVTSCVAGSTCSGICPGGGSGFVDGAKKEIACVCG